MSNRRSDNTGESRTLRQLTAIRQNNVGRLFLRAHKVFDTFVLSRLGARGFTEIRSVHLAIIRGIDLQGSRITDIAREAWMTKQGAGQLVKELEAFGFVRTLRDPHDARARIVVFTEHGFRYIEAATEVFAEIDAIFADALGAAEVGQLRATLERLVDHFGTGAAPTDSPG